MAELSPAFERSRLVDGFKFDISREIGRDLNGYEDGTENPDDDAKACYRTGWSEEDLTIAITVCSSWNWFNRMILGYGIDKKWDEKVFRERGAPDKMANGYKAYYDEMIAKGFGDTSGSKNLPPPAV
jgi:deferrochelatase/peroxidase EfeB